MRKVKVFLASSQALAKARCGFEIMVNRRNKRWIDEGLFLDLIVWEDFLDAVAKGGLQRRYNDEIQGCDIFVMMFADKVGMHTQAEFDAAVGQFTETGRPFVFTYFLPNDSAATPSVQDSASLAAFKARLTALRHYQTKAENHDALLRHFEHQLEALKTEQFQQIAAAPPGLALTASDGSVVNTGQARDIVTGTQVNTGGGAYFGGPVSAGRDVVGGNKRGR